MSGKVIIDPAQGVVFQTPATATFWLEDGTEVEATNVRISGTMLGMPIVNIPEAEA